jgi:hypothetical protein
MSIQAQGCCDYEADIRILTNPTSTYGKINGRKVHPWDGSTLKSRVNFVQNGSKYAFFMVAVAIITGIAAAILIPFSFPLSFFCGSVAILSIVGVDLLKRIHGYVTRELKKQYALNAQAYLDGGPIGAFKRKCEFGLFKNSEDLEMMEVNLDKSIEVDTALQAANNTCDGVFKQKFLESLKSQQERFEKMRGEDLRHFENLVVNWFQGKRADSDLSNYCVLQGRSWSVPQISVQNVK